MTFKPLRSFRKWNRARRLRNRLRQSGFWYVDIPRTGSSWLRELLFEAHGWPHGKASFLTPGRKKGTTEFFSAHTTAAEVRRAVGNEVWNSLFTFSVVRNPFDRIASLFLYYKNTEKIFIGDFREFCSAIETSGYWVPEHRFRSPLWTSQKKFLTDQTGELLVRHIGRYEKHHEFVETLRQTIGLGVVPSSVFNPSVGKPEGGLRGLYDTRTASFVADFFAEDFETFDYPKKLE